jgi:hypothetical protein
MSRAYGAHEGDEKCIKILVNIKVDLRELGWSVWIRFIWLRIGTDSCFL